MSASKYYFLNALNLGILIVNENREVVFVNEWLSARARDGIFTVGEPLSYDSKKSYRIEEAIERAVDNGMSSLLTHRLNGSPFELSLGTIKVSYNLSISRFSKSDSKSVVIQFIDVTQVKEREKYLTDKQQLIDVHEEREIHQEKLNSFIEMTSRIAHEINNPLAILATNTKLMKSMLEERNLYNDDFKEVIDDADETLLRIEKLVRSVEDLAYIPKNSDFKPVKIRKIIDEVVENFQEDFISKGVEFKVQTENKALDQRVEINQVLIRKLIYILTSNSLKYIEDLTEKWIEVSAELFEKRIQIQFTDSGRGIPDSLKDDIFLPFFTTDQIGDGSSGLGLTTAVKIAEAHLGSLSLDKDCSYTRFILTLPLKRS